MQAVSIYDPIQDRLDRVNDRLDGLNDVPFSFLSELIGHVVTPSGKRVRPAITLLASSFCDHDTDVTETMATAVELLHIATLIHDDTVDESDLRHGQVTVSSLWGRNVAVLLGDYLFANSATHVCDTRNVYVIRRFSETIMELATGELFELAESFNWRQTKEQYFERIYNKTASLFTIAGESGGILSGAPDDMVEKLKRYAYNLGMAFQIIDDILDFKATSEEVGKPVGSDLAHGIMTLPAILAVERYPNDNRVKTLFKEPGDQAALAQAVDLIQDAEIMDGAHAEAERLCNDAVQCLESFPRTTERASLEDLVDYVLSRRS